MDTETVHSRMACYRSIRIYVLVIILFLLSVPLRAETMEDTILELKVQVKALQERIEGPGKEVTFTKNGKRAILNKLVEAEGFEKFLHVKFTGTKRFGLDGGEAVVPAMEQIIKRGGNLGLEEIVLGMPHRGRLNVLAAVMAKPHCGR